MYKTSVYTLVNGNIQGLTQRKQQKLQKVILSALIDSVSMCCC